MLTELNAKYEGSYLLEYYGKCANGEIIIGQKMKLCLNNLLNDLQDDQYQFNLTETKKRVKFIEKQYRHSITPFGGQKNILAMW